MSEKPARELDPDDQWDNYRGPGGRPIAQLCRLRAEIGDFVRIEIPIVPWHLLTLNPEVVACVSNAGLMIPTRATLAKLLKVDESVIHITMASDDHVDVVGQNGAVRLLKVVTARSMRRFRGPIEPLGE